MKAERRHELQTNSLALWIRWRAPIIWEQHGTKILLGLIVVALVVMAVRWRVEAPKKAAARANAYLADAENTIGRLRDLTTAPGEATTVPDRVRKALDESDRPEIQARAYLVLGDYYWALANWPPLPQAATQPSLRPTENQPELLVRAEEAYQKSVKVDADHPILFARAEIGLGVIAETRAFQEDRRNKNKTRSPLWQTAIQQYQAILDNPKVPQVLKDEAKWHLANIARLQEPVWLVPATLPTTQESFVPSTQKVFGPEDLSSTTKPASTRPVK